MLGALNFNSDMKEILTVATVKAISYTYIGITA